MGNTYLTVEQYWLHWGKLSNRYYILPIYLLPVNISADEYQTPFLLLFWINVLDQGCLIVSLKWFYFFKFNILMFRADVTSHKRFLIFNRMYMCTWTKRKKNPILLNEIRVRLLLDHIHLLFPKSAVGVKCFP